MKRWVIRYSVEAVMSSATSQREAQEALATLTRFVNNGEIIAPAESQVNVTGVSLNRESIDEEVF